MQLLKGAFGLAFVTAAYIAALIWVDAKNDHFDSVPRLLGAVPLMIGASLGSFLLRYIRWRWLLGRAGLVMPFGRGLAAYLAGFALTATPGKLGELVRIRYFGPIGVPAHKVVSAFVFERLLDLFVLLAMSLLAVRRMDLVLLAAAFTMLVAGAIAIFVAWPSVLRWLDAWLTRLRMTSLVRVVRIVGDGLGNCRLWLNLIDVSVGTLLGAVAWSLTTLSFLLLVRQLAMPVPMIDAIAIYPLSMLVGAASMLPGGLGSTEAAIYALLAAYGVETPQAVLAAIGIRLTTLWLAILCGLLCMAGLEYGRAQVRDASHETGTT